MKTVVVKIGTSTLTQGSKRLSKRHMLEFARLLARFHEQGHRILLVTSGAVCAGREILNHPKVDRSLPEKQMFAAVGQSHLMRIWSDLFHLFETSVGQVLLTRGDFVQRQQYLNVRDTLFSLFRHRVIPIINENDTVAVKESKFGDNDNLSALVANLVAADLLVILTDCQGLYTDDPRTNCQAELIQEVHQIDQKIYACAGGGGGSALGTGGMLTKIAAAKLATETGTTTVIASGSSPEILERLLSGEKVGTWFLPQTSKNESRKRWLISEKIQGKVSVDQGAVLRLKKHGASLLAVGITQVEGSFARGSVVQLLSPEKMPIAVGITTYDHDEVAKIIGAHSSQIEPILGYSYGHEIIHRDDLVLLNANFS